MDMTGIFPRLVRAALRMDPDRETPQIDRLALYRARVVSCSSDGTTLDLEPEDERVAAVQGVPVRVGMPGVTAVVAAGAVVLLGWEKGDPSRPYAAPAWEPGASVTKLVINGTVVYLGAEAGAQFVALANLVKNELDKIQTTIESFSPATGDGVEDGGGFETPYTASAVAAAQTKAK